MTCQKQVITTGQENIWSVFLFSKMNENIQGINIGTISDAIQDGAESVAEKLESWGSGAGCLLLGPIYMGSIPMIMLMPAEVGRTLTGLIDAYRLSRTDWEISWNLEDRVREEMKINFHREYFRDDLQGQHEAGLYITLDPTDANYHANTRHPIPLPNFLEEKLQRGFSICGKFALSLAAAGFGALANSYESGHGDQALWAGAAIGALGLIEIAMKFANHNLARSNYEKFMLRAGH